MPFRVLTFVFLLALLALGLFLVAKRGLSRPLYLVVDDRCGVLCVSDSLDSAVADWFSALGDSRHFRHSVSLYSVGELRLLRSATSISSPNCNPPEAVSPQTKEGVAETANGFHPCFEEGVR